MHGHIYCRIYVSPLCARLRIDLGVCLRFYLGSSSIYVQSFCVHLGGCLKLHFAARSCSALVHQELCGSLGEPVPVHVRVLCLLQSHLEDILSLPQG